MAKKSSGAKPRAQKTKKSAPGAEALHGKKGHNVKTAAEQRTDDQVRSDYVRLRSPWNGAMANLKAAEKRLADVVASVKAAGFTKKQFQIGDQLGTVKGEARVTGEVADRLKVARWLGHPMGAQLDMFNEPDRTPLKERAYDAGRMASMQNEPRKPPHSPDTEASRSWLDGYSSHQRELAGGFKAPPASARPDDVKGDVEASGLH